MPAIGQDVIGNDNLLFGLNAGGFGFTVFQDSAASDFTGVTFGYNGTTVTPGLVNLDEGSDWYVVHPGDVFSSTTIAAGEFQPLITFGPTGHPPVAVGSGDFYLGVNTGLGFDIPDDRTVFGWVHLRQVLGSLAMVDNVMSYESRGIVVGTSTVVPEPSTTMLLAASLAIAVFSRRRHLS
jgi:hypothetical protein